MHYACLSSECSLEMVIKSHHPEILPEGKADNGKPVMTVGPRQISELVIIRWQSTISA